MEDTLDGRRPGWRLRLGVARAGLRERGHVLSGPAGKRALSRWLVLLHASMTPGQQSRSQAYGAVFSATTLLIVAAIGLWASAGRAVKKHLDLAPRIRAAETLLAAVILTGVSTMVPVQVIWFAAIRSSTVWLDLGLALLAMTLFTAPRTLRRARRADRRQRAAAVPRR